ncbi:hypothetical protein FB451DRAFT_1554797 [Mycena latifolia]|nr:hypothetical protein FB451DRAFT_1554797 [Mycena latifolia]
MHKAVSPPPPSRGSRPLPPPRPPAHLPPSPCAAAMQRRSRARAPSGSARTTASRRCGSTRSAIARSSYKRRATWGTSRPP